MSHTQKDTAKRILGQILLDMGKIEPMDIEIALREQKRTGSPLGDIFIRNEIVSEEEAYEALAHQFDLQLVLLKDTVIDPAVQDALPLDFIKEKGIIPIRMEETLLVVAITTPGSLVDIDEVQRLTGKYIQPVLMTPSDMSVAMERFFLTDLPMEERIEQGLTRYEELRVSLDDRTDEVLACVVELLDNVFKMAHNDRATDIHFEPAKNVTRIRFRIDGVLRPGPTLPKAIHESVVSRIKILSKLKIDETRVAQDGKAIFNYLNQALDLRVSIIPTLYGESVVIRILERSSLQKDLSEVGFDARSMELYLNAVARKNGIVLITGPTGCGKTTTLSSTISYLNSYSVNVVTIEDPVEYEIPFVRQIQVNEKHGIGFESGMRALLRHDPDIILLGEMRDLASAQIAIRASMTGHLVLSTLHTNTAVDSLPRLVELGIQPFILASALRAVVAQRLLRRICPDCKTEATVDPEILAHFKELIAQSTGSEGGNPTFYKGEGCPRCNYKGNVGRVAIFEILVVTPEIRSLISADERTEVIQHAAIDQGMKLLVADAYEKAKLGLISLEEAFTVSLE